MDDSTLVRPLVLHFIPYRMKQPTAYDAASALWEYRASVMQARRIAIDEEAVAAYFAAPKYSRERCRVFGCCPFARRE